MLARLRGELRSAIARRLVWRLAAAVVGGLWVVLVLDRLLEPPGQVRLVVWSVLGVAALGWLALVAAPRVLKPIRDRDLLTLLNRERQREVALIATAIDLRLDASTTGSRLAARTIHEADLAAEALGEVSVVRRTRESGWTWFAVVAATGLLTLTVVRPDLTSIFAQRLALSEALWPRRVELRAEGFAFDPATGEWLRHAPRGEPVELAVIARVAPEASPPRTVWSRSRGSTIRLTALTRVGRPIADAEGVAQPFRRRLERLDEDQAFTLWGGDGKLRLRLLATDRPRLTDLTLFCQTPDYLGSSIEDFSLATLDTLPEGSRVTIRGRSTRGLESLAVSVQTADSAREEVEEFLLTEDGHHFEATLPPLREAVVVTLIGADTWGLSSEKKEIAIDCAADRPPTAALALDGVGRAITRDAVIGAVVRVDDDHGLGAASLHLRSGEQKARIDLAPPRALPGRVTAEADLLSLRSSGPNRFVLQVGDRLRLFARVRDGYNLAPRGPANSQTIDMEVVTPAELLARLGESQRQLRVAIETLQADTERLNYEIGLGARRLQAAEEEASTQDDLPRWSAERMLDARKAARGVIGAAEQADGIRRQVLANRLGQPALVDRLDAGVIAPLRRVARNDLAKTSRLLRDPDEEDALTAAAAAADQASKTLARVATSLDSQQTYNEVVSLLRGLIREQRRVNERTSKQESDRVRSLFD